MVDLIADNLNSFEVGSLELGLLAQGYMIAVLEGFDLMVYKSKNNNDLDKNIH